MIRNLFTKHDMTAGKYTTESSASQAVIHWVMATMVFVVMWCFSQEYVAGKLNERTLNVQQQMDRINHHFNWPLSGTKDLVGDIDNDWQQVTSGFVSLHSEPVMSLAFDSRDFDPTLYQQLSVDVQLNGAGAKEATVRLEFSNQDQGKFYYAPPMNLSQLKNPLQLTDWQWFLLDEQGKAIGKPLQWTGLGGLNGLVLRFYLSAESTVEVRGVSLPQYQPRQWLMPKVINCQDAYKDWLSCAVTNRMNHLDEQHNNGISHQFMTFSVFNTVSPMLWLAVGWLVMLFLIWQVNPQAPLVVWVLVSSVFVLIFVLHQVITLTLAAHLRTAVMGLSLVLLLVYAGRIWRVEKAGWPLWLMIILVFLAVVYGLSLPLSFVQQLPAYFLWALIQQTLLGPVFSDELKTHLKTSDLTTAWLVAVLFAIIHAPNHSLMLATLLGGFIWSWSWLVYRNIYLNAFSHALLALLFYEVSPEAWLGSARIGLFF
ncbi:CPBP family intramembrane glutamic endopeptidase [Marinicella sediminis]|uniref:CPBP family intramembrane glutamic endopeptidase n=1 Tax=Marinicella sediminis TaxID=1792834 RepID=A0ABV7JBA2_9GAMM|nr:type II CAAX endopeptidase family protein [Marinicella sediminis]